MENKNENELVLVNKYLTVVRRNLFMGDKEEIITDLRDNILEQLNGDYSEENIKTVLEGLGDPARLAIKYHTSNKYLIGPDIYDSYLYATKISLQIGTIVYIILLITTGAIDVYMNTFNVLSYIGQFIGNYIFMIFQIFLWTTLTFAVLEKTLSSKKINEALNEYLVWDISKLNSVHTEKQIKKSDAIATIVMTAIMYFAFISLRNFSIEINENTYYILNQSILSETIILFGISSLLSILVQVLLLIKGVWTKSLVVFDLIVQLIGIYISYYLIVDLKLFNILEESFLANSRDNIYFGINLGIIIVTVCVICTSIYKFIKVSSK